MTNELTTLEPLANIREFGGHDWFLSCRKNPYSS